MPSIEFDLLCAFETHDVKAIRAILDRGFDVTPISYAQFGLLPQVGRTERDIYDNIARLLEAARRRVPPLENIPNRYLAS